MASKPCRYHIRSLLTGSGRPPRLALGLELIAASRKCGGATWGGRPPQVDAARFRPFRRPEQPEAARTLAGLQAARARGRTGGRPPALKAKDIAAAKALLRDPEITVAEVAKRLGVVPSTLYRHLPRARTAALEASS